MNQPDTSNREKRTWQIGVALAVASFALILALPVHSGLARAAYGRLLTRLPKDISTKLQSALRASPKSVIENDAAAFVRVAGTIPVRVHRKNGRIVSERTYNALSGAAQRRFGARQTVAALAAELARAARAVLATAVVMMLSWIFTLVPTAITALFPLLLFPALGVAGLANAGFPGYFKVSAQYGHHLIFLFMGTFIVSQAMIRWGLDRRIAVMILRLCGNSPRRLMLGFIGAAGFLSMWITNTATTAMLAPTALAVLEGVRHPEKRRFTSGTLLSIAYAATVGGIGTLVGTAPNAVYAGFAASLANHQVSFVEWLRFGMPFVLIFLPILWFVQVKRFIPEGLTLPSGETLGAPRRMSRGEKQVAIVFCVMVVLWLTRRPIAVIGFPGWSAIHAGVFRLAEFNDAAVAMFGAILLFALPVDLKNREFNLDLRTGLDISWGTLLLFGGGLALGRGIAETGVAHWFADLLQVLAQAGPHVLVLSITLLASLLTEITSNTATATMLMPVMYALGRSMGGKELLFMSTAAVSTSLAFMSPIGTPPNAIIYGTGQVTMKEMFRSGVLLNCLAVLVWWLTAMFLVA